jgi:hypothetical protein
MRVLIALLAMLLATPVAAQKVDVQVNLSFDGRNVLSHRVTVPARIEKVWYAVATVEGWQEWAVPLARAIPGTNRFETSYDPSAPPGSPVTIEQEWLNRLEPQSVIYRTTRTPAGFPDAETFFTVKSTILLLELEPGKTEVYLFMDFPRNEAGDRLIDFFREGNRITLEQLHERFVSGPRDWSVASE